MRRVLLALVLLVAAAAPLPRAAAESTPSDVHDIVFPVVGEVHYTDTFGAPRAGGRAHEGEDLLGSKMQELVAADSGTIQHLVWPEGSYGNYLQIKADDGWTYSYVHINNDTPGTDDNSAPRQYVYADGIDDGVHVERGQLVAYMGDSGNAESTSPHLHFEMHEPDGTVINPMASLDAAQRLDAPAGQTVEPSPIPRIAGVDRVATAVAASTRGWPDGAPSVVLAAGDQYAEALPASVLAARDAVPMLLTTGGTLSKVVSDELARLHAKAVTVIGSVPAAVDAQLKDSGLAVKRLGTAGDVVATSVAIAREIGGAGGIAVLVNRDRFADGISASALAAGRGWPILLTSATVVPQPTVDAWRALGVDDIVLVGGTGVIGQNVEDFVRRAGGCETGQPGSACTAERLAGPDRYATSVATTQRSLDAGGRTVGELLLGTGATFPDSLTAGPLAARLQGIAVLVDGTGRLGDGASRGWLSDHRAAVDDVSIIGGAGAVTSAADRAIQEALGVG